MIKILVSLLFGMSAYAAIQYPPTTSQGSGDSSNITTFNFQFPNFSITRTGVTTQFNILGIAGGGTGAATTSQNYVFAGPASGGSGAPSFRLLTTADLPSVISIGAFDTNPNANGLLLTGNELQMEPASASYPGGVSATTQTFAGSKTFNGLIGANAGVTILPLNTATSSNNYSSNAFNQDASYWTGSAAATDVWTMQVVLGSGANPYSILNFGHAGTSGADVVYMPGLDNTPVGPYAPSTGSFTTLKASSTLTVTGISSLDNTAITTNGSGTFTAGVWHGTLIGSTYGGTGATNPTAHAVAIAEGSSAMNFVSPSTASYALISAGASNDPIFAQIDLAAGVRGITPVANGGTGVATITQNGIPFGNGTSAIGVTAQGNPGQVLSWPGVGSNPAPASLPGNSTILKAPNVITFTSNAASTTGTVSTSSVCITSVGSTIGIVAGAPIVSVTSGHTSDITQGTTVVAVPGTCSAGQVQMSAVASSAGTGDTLVFGTLYTPSTNPSPLWAEIEMVGGGGGGASSGTGSNNAGAAGTSTYFFYGSTNNIIAGGGSGATAAGLSAGGPGGTCSSTGSFMTFIRKFTGMPGGDAAVDTDSISTTQYISGGLGGVSPYGGAGASTSATGSGRATAVANTGSGGGGSGIGAVTSSYAGGGGGAGCWTKFIVPTPTTTASTFYVIVGLSGNGGSAGTSGGAGGTGALGGATVIEHFQ